RRPPANRTAAASAGRLAQGTSRVHQYRVTSGSPSQRTSRGMSRRDGGRRPSRGPVSAGPNIRTHARPVATGTLEARPCVRTAYQESRGSGGLWVARTPDLSDVNAAL